LLKKVSASNPERYQIIRRSFRVLRLNDTASGLSLGGRAGAGSLIRWNGWNSVPYRPLIPP
jgi:hypothetical protein